MASKQPRDIKVLFEAEGFDKKGNFIHKKTELGLFEDLKLKGTRIDSTLINGVFNQWLADNFYSSNKYRWGFLDRVS